jgi:hypothetical protein
MIRQKAGVPGLFSRISSRDTTEAQRALDPVWATTPGQAERQSAV